MDQLNAIVYADDVDFLQPHAKTLKLISLLYKTLSPDGPFTLMRLRLSERTFPGLRIQNGVASGNWAPYMAIMRK